MDSGKRFRLVDVREQDEWEICRLAGAELVPLSSWHETWLNVFNDPEEEMVLYCHHGVRSGNALKFLIAKGFSKVDHLEGGIDAWARTIDPGVPTY